MLDPDVVMRALGHELIIDLDRREPGGLGHADGPMHVHGIAVPTRAVEDERQRRNRADVESGLTHLGQIEVRLQRDLLIPGRAPAEITRAEPGRLGHPRHQRIEHERRGHGQRSFGQQAHRHASGVKWSPGP